MATSDERIRARLNHLEQEARDHPRRHALRLGALTGLGYAYPLTILAITLMIALGLLALAPMAFRASEAAITVFWAIGLILSLLLVIGVLKSFSIKIPIPDGYALRTGEAPALRQLVEQVRASAGTGPIHQIHIDFNLNAAAAQSRKYGFWGTRTNYLVLGIPLLMVLEPDELKAVVAHELGHLRGHHNTFSAWVYRVFHTWESLAVPLREHKLLRFLMGWFLRWYGDYYAFSTIPLRRLHEYSADRTSADCVGPAATARALYRIHWAAYRLDRDFWAGLFSEAGQESLPPKSILNRIADYFTKEPNPAMVERWRQRSLRTRTPITTVHPCLRERLSALGHGEMIEQSRNTVSEESGIQSWMPLLGDSAQRIAAICDASWKAAAIERWRIEHAHAKFLRERIEERDRNNEGKELTIEQRWEQAELEARYVPPAQAMACLREFTSRFPDHAPAHFALGHLLLNQDDESAIAHLEAAGRNDSDYIGPALHQLLEYYREAGRDSEADPVRERMVEHERAISRAQQERVHVRRKDRFVPHGQGREELENLRKVLFRYPQIQMAYLVRKAVSVFADKPSYVLAIYRRAPSLEDQSRADKALVEGLQSAVSIRCAAVILGWTNLRLTRRIKRACPEPIFVSPD